MKYINKIYFILFNISTLVPYHVSGQLVNVSKDCQSLNNFFQIDPTINCCDDICTEYDTLTEDVECIDNISVECDADNNIIHLINESCKFNDENLNVDFSKFPVLSRLKELEIINMQGSVLPSNLFDLPSLEILKISNSTITEVANEINPQSVVKELHLENNHIKTFPYQLGNLPNLKYLNLNNNEIEGEITKDISKFSNIENIELNNNIDVFFLPEEISDLKNLKVLDMGKTDLTELPSNIFKLTNLKSFNISYIPDLNAKIIKFGSPVDECNFENTTIHCYQPDACKKIIGTNKYKECTTDEINEILKAQKETYNEKMYRYKIIGSIGGTAAFIMGILIGFIMFNRHRRNVKKRKALEESRNNNNIYVSERIIVLPDGKTTDNIELTTSETPATENHVHEDVKENHHESEASSESIYDAYPTSPTLGAQDHSNSSAPSDPSNRNTHRNRANRSSVAKDGMGNSSYSPASPSSPSSRFRSQSHMLSQYQEDTHSDTPHPEEPPIYSPLNETNHTTSHHRHEGNDYLDNEMDIDNVLPPYSAMNSEASPSLNSVSTPLTHYSTEFENDTANDTQSQYSSTIPRGTSINYNMTSFMNRNTSPLHGEGVDDDIKKLMDEFDLDDKKTK